MKTPLKYYETLNGYSGSKNYSIRDADGRLLAKFLTLDDATLFCKAVNSYDARTLLLQMLLAHLEGTASAQGQALFEKIVKVLNG